MRNRERLALLAFFALSLANIFFVMTSSQAGIYFTKPLLMVSLAAWYLLRTTPLHFLDRLVLAALAFSMAGDTLLLFAVSDQLFFLMGLGSFLIAHLFYISAFVAFPGFRRGWVVKAPFLVVPVFGYLACMLWYLWPDLPDAFRLPVAVYSCVITLMLLAGLHLRNRIPDPSFFLIGSGATLFVLSDSFIALSKFKTAFLPDETAGLLIMSTYLAGQFLLISGLARICPLADRVKEKGMVEGRG